MLAKTTMTDVWGKGQPAAAPDIDYTGFPVWHALLVEPNGERRSAEWLKRVNVHVYLPLFQISYFRHGVRRTREKAVVPGILFVPVEFMAIPRRDEVLDWARVRGFLRSSEGPSRISKAAIERIKAMEAKLNQPDKPCDARGVVLEVGQAVRFLDPANADIFGDGTIVEVASFNRIGVETKKLFGQAIPIYTPSSEIEVL